MIWKYLEKNVLFPKDLNWVQHSVSRIGLLLFGKCKEIPIRGFDSVQHSDKLAYSLRNFLQTMSIIKGILIFFHVWSCHFLEYLMMFENYRMKILYHN